MKSLLLHLGQVWIPIWGVLGDGLNRSEHGELAQDIVASRRPIRSADLLIINDLEEDTISQRMGGLWVDQGELVVFPKF
jgi:hypothetical protein